MHSPHSSSRHLSFTHLTSRRQKRKPQSPAHSFLNPLHPTPPQVFSSSMEETPSNIRKRKQFSSSTSLKPPMGPVTRSQRRSGRACSDTPSRRNTQQPQLNPDSSLKKPKSFHCPVLENGASSLYLSIKDLRARARRVFSPSGAVAGKNELGFYFGEGISDGSLKIMINSGNFQFGLKKNSDLGSDSESGVGVSDIVEKEKSPNKDLEPGRGDQGLSSVIDMDTNKINQVESGNDCYENQRNGPISCTRPVQKSSSRGKVYKSPSLFSYRRLLPFLTDMVKEESCSSTARIKIVDEDYKVGSSTHVNSSSSLTLIHSKFAENKNIGEDSNGTRPSDKGCIENVEIQQEVLGQVLQGPDEELPQNEEDMCSSNVEGRSHENGLNGSHELIEEYIQTTPPDSTILSELDFYDTDANAEVNNLKIQNAVLGHQSNGRTCGNHVSVLKRFRTSPTRRNSTISTTKLVLNPCSRSKIYKTSSSFSYRRLLPFLIDVAKSSNDDPPPKFQKNVENRQHSELLASLDNDMMLNKNEACDFQGKQEKCQEFPTDINAHPVDSSSDCICLKLSTPPFSSGSEISLGKSNSASPKNFTESDMQNGLQMERTSPPRHAHLDMPRDFEGKLQNADIRVCDDEDNLSVETSSSSVNRGSLPGVFRMVVSHNQPVDIVKNCTTKGQVYHKDKVNKTNNATLDQSTLKTQFDYLGESPTKGILKRNPRGCRGLCNCLNCSSFRLHAERAFEFSRNQLLDAEEVALTLINEVAELRDMLGKYVADGIGLASIQLNQLQVRESCKKALALEQETKQRLSQMNDDLNVHCRITPLQRLRVTFSRLTEVKPIPDTKLS